METEKSLLQRAQQYDLDALAQIYDKYSPGLYRYAMRLVGDEDLAEECVADTFDRFLTVLKGGRGPERYLQAYLYRVAHNWITDYYRRRPPPTLPLEPDRQHNPGSDPQQIVARRTEAERVRNALRLLTSEQRQVVVLKYLEGGDNKDIAEAVDKQIGAVKALQYRALRSMRRILMKEEIL